ncbi:MAG: tRNA (adenosine(37)-N6)-dimethylallyltransferase MiaA [Acidobacteria bacterium]|nr:MAG: tRNA (adenosine(37)-N6)-dimethylallyltransferase MiaA [Acidobacteriota bacterium]
MVWVIAVLGPTATGKTALGIRLAEALGGEIVNADALQVYRGLDVGTAKPTAEERRRVPHHLIDVLEPDEPCSAGELARRARRVIAELDRRGVVPIVVGGSGLYLRAVLDGLSPIPPVDPAVRASLAQRLEREGLAALYAELERRDPVTARRLQPADRQRILRALEVVTSSGTPLSAWIRRRPAGYAPLDARRIGLTLPRAILYDRVARRVRQMVERGWVAEVKALLGRGVDPGAPAFQAIGYRQMVDHVLGRVDLETAVDDTIRATRRYAKRQLTWFRKEHDVEWLPVLDLPARFPSLLRTLEARRRKLAE